MKDMLPMLNCDAVMRLLWDYLDGELTAERTQAIREHLAICARCLPQLEFERGFLDLLGRARRGHRDYEALRARIVFACLFRGSQRKHPPFS
jgi:anti-sigma factor (TIGR02949 family)